MPLSDKTVWQVCTEAASSKRALLNTSRRTPCAIREATHLLEAGTDLRTIQMLLLDTGDLETTSRYIHLSREHLHTAANPLGKLQLFSTSRQAIRGQNVKIRDEPARRGGGRYSPRTGQPLRTDTSRVSIGQQLKAIPEPIQKCAAPRLWVDISIPVHNAGARPSPITPAGTGTALSARHRHGSVGSLNESKSLFHQLFLPWSSLYLTN